MNPANLSDTVILATVVVSTVVSAALGVVFGTAAIRLVQRFDARRSRD